MFVYKFVKVYIYTYEKNKKTLVGANADGRPQRPLKMTES